MGAIYTMWLRDMKWFVRSKARVISMFTTPFLWLAIIGLGMGSVVQIPGGYLNFLAPGIVGMAILFTSTMTGVSVLWDKQFGFMKEILVAPVSRTSVMVGKALGGATSGILQGLMILLAATLVGASMPDVAGFFLVLLFMFMIALTFVSMGLAFASKIEDPVAFPIVMNFLIMPIFFLSGAIFPLATAPGWMQAIAYINPMTYGVDGLRGAIGGAAAARFPLWFDFAVLGLFCLAMILLGGYLFKKMKA